jgi:hypothetical protein
LSELTHNISPLIVVEACALQTSNKFNVRDVYPHPQPSDNGGEGRGEVDKDGSKIGMVNMGA